MEEKTENKEKEVTETDQLMWCITCGERVAVKAYFCQHCGQPYKKNVMNTAWMIVFRVAIVTAIFGIALRFLLFPFFL